MSVNETLRALCLANGVNGQPDAADEAAARLAPYCDTVTHDALGNVIGWRRGGDESLPTLLLTAHIDQIGFVVTGVEDTAGGGFVRVAAAGGADNRVLTAAEVTVYGDRPYAGVFCSVPPHLGGGELPAVTDRGIDVGMTADEAKAHIPVGSRVALRAHYTPLLGERVAATSMDDRSGVAVVLRCLELLDGEDLPWRVAVAFMQGEELGMRGAAPASFALAPDAAIATDVSFAYMPQETREECGELGKGPMIGIAPTLDAAFSRRLAALAEAANIPFQNEVMGETTGTDADKIGISRGGVRTALLSIPLRYMHTAVEVADLGDVENTARLMAEFARKEADAVC